jgi:signal transduction histidine kinase/CheY-like chemotaxis protein
MQVLAALGFILVLLSGAAAVYMATRLGQAEELVSFTFKIRVVARQLMSALQDAEIGQRGYLLTDNESFLQPYNDAKLRIPDILKNLSNLVAQHPVPVQERRVETAEQLITGKLTELEQTISLERDGRHSDAIAVVKAGQGRHLMDGIRGVLTDFSETELLLLNQREKMASRMRDIMLAVTIVSLLLAATVGLLMIRLTRHHLARLDQAETRLRQTQKMDAVGQLTGGLAHDFNNLLTIIIGSFNNLQRRVANLGEEAQTKLAPLIEGGIRAAHNAATLTHRLLAFSRQQALEPRRLVLNRLIADMSDLLHRTVGENVKIETVLAAGLWPTFADPNQVENALLNLVLNARDAMSDGGKITIETANTYLDDAYVMQFGDVRAGQYVLLSVTDTGTGIPSDVLEKVFDPFFTTKPAGIGSGLGLSMVHGFAKQSDGHVRIYSEVGQGTTVKLYLPRLVAPEPLTLPTPEAQRQLSVLTGSGERVLVVEDNEGVREYASAALRESGYQVVAVNDGEEALRLIEDGNQFDVLFTDVVLPGINGRILAAKATEKLPTLAVLYTTGYTKNAITHQGRLDTNVNLLSKPFTHQDLARKIRGVLTQKGTQPTGATAKIS